MSSSLSFWQKLIYFHQRHFSLLSSSMNNHCTTVLYKCTVPGCECKHWKYISESENIKCASLIFLLLYIYYRCLRKTYWLFVLSYDEPKYNKVTFTEILSHYDRCLLTLGIKWVWQHKKFLQYSKFLNTAEAAVGDWVSEWLVIFCQWSFSGSTKGINF